MRRMRLRLPSKAVSQNLENALKVLLSLYNRFSGREDIPPEYLQVGDTISLYEFIIWIDNHKESPALELLTFIMINWVVRRHELIAFRKMTEGRDGYFVEIVDGKYYPKFITTADFTGNRMIQLMTVMKDLGMLV